MWEISNGFQIIGFLRAFVLGGIFCLIYDFLRALRKSGVNSDSAVFWQDIIYFIIISPITFCFLLATTNGEMRAYFFIGMLVGFIGIRLTLSIIFLKVLLKVITLYLKVFCKFKLVINLIFNHIYKFYCYIKEFLRKNLLKLINCFKKLLKKQ